MQIRAIVVIYDGKEAPNYIIEKIAEQMIPILGPEKNVMPFQLDSSDIAGYLAANAVPKVSGTYSVKEKDEKPGDMAVTYIGTVMKESLASPFDANRFIADLTTRIAEIQVNPLKDPNRQFMNALFILSKDGVEVSAKVLKKYNMSVEKIGLIRSVYNIVSKF